MTTCEISALHRSLGDLTADGVGPSLAEAKALLAEAAVLDGRLHDLTTTRLAA